METEMLYMYHIFLFVVSGAKSEITIFTEILELILHIASTLTSILRWPFHAFNRT